MTTHVNFIYNRQQLNTKYRYTTSRFDPSLGEIIGIMVTVLDDENKVVDRRYYKVVEEEKDD